MSSSFPNKLSIINADNGTHTFVKKAKAGQTLAKSFRDHTFVNYLTHPFLRHWQFADTHIFCDQKYIEYIYQITPIYTMKRRYSTKHVNLIKITNLLKANKHILKKLQNDTINSEQHNAFVETLIETTEFATFAPSVSKLPAEKVKC